MPLVVIGVDEDVALLNANRGELGQTCFDQRSSLRRIARADRQRHASAVRRGSCPDRGVSFLPAHFNVERSSSVTALPPMLTAVTRQVSGIRARMHSMGLSAATCRTDSRRHRRRLLNHLRVTSILTGKRRDRNLVRRLSRTSALFAKRFVVLTLKRTVEAPATTQLVI